MSTQGKEIIMNANALPLHSKQFGPDIDQLRLDCCARCKRLPGGVWEEATSPEEDHSYLLWTLGGWLRTVIGRIARRVPPTK